MYGLSHVRRLKFLSIHNSNLRDFAYMKNPLMWGETSNKVTREARTTKICIPCVKVHKQYLSQCAGVLKAFDWIGSNRMSIVIFTWWSQQRLKDCLGFCSSLKVHKNMFWIFKYFKTMALSFILAFLEIDILDQALKSEKRKLVVCSIENGMISFPIYLINLNMGIVTNNLMFWLYLQL